jgi:hypothetical protein
MGYRAGSELVVNGCLVSVMSRWEDEIENVTIRLSGTGSRAINPQPYSVLALST